MVAHAGQGFFTKRVWTLMLVWASVGLVAVSGDTWGMYDCPGRMGNRHIYDKVSRVCDDCYNIFRSSDISVRCRRDCFINEDFMLCLRAADRHEEITDFQRWISILSSGRK